MRLDNTFPEDPLKGWRVPGVVRFLYSTQPRDEAVMEQVKSLNHGVVDYTTVANVVDAGTFRANRLRDLVPEAWFDSPYYHCYFRGIGYDDAVYVAFPVNQDAESWFGIFRACGEPGFTCSERDTLAYALRGIKWFHRRLIIEPRAAGRQYAALARRAARTPPAAHRDDGKRNRPPSWLGRLHYPPVRHQPVPQIQRAQPRRSHEPVAEPRNLKSGALSSISTVE